MKIVTLNEENVYLGDLIIVNRDHPIKSDHPVSLLAANPLFPGIKMEKRAAKMLRKILILISAGMEIVPVSGFRSETEQREIYDGSLFDNGLEFTEKYVAKPGTSEHQTGLAIDLGKNSENIDFIRPEFPYDGICGEFRNAAPYYGFIERYPEGKEKITNIACEPWHFRYIGYPHSLIASEKGLVLEEYIQFIKGYSQNGAFRCQGKFGCADIFYIPAKSGKTELCLPDRAEYEISGNNCDGFIVTARERK